jgi:hypothetical protein
MTATAQRHAGGVVERAFERAMDGLWDGFTYLVMSGGRERRLTWTRVGNGLAGAWRTSRHPVRPTGPRA